MDHLRPEEPTLPAAWPGWLFYASTEMNPRNPIWHDVSAVNDYVARCQAFLQSGKPDNDVLLYWPIADFWSSPQGRLQRMAVSATDWFEGQPIGKAAHELWSGGYSFDYISDAQLQKAKTSKGSIQVPGGRYQVIIVPECKLMPLDTLKQLAALAKNGATVIFEKQLPTDIPGLANLASDRKDFQKLVAQLQKGSSFGKGKIVIGNLPTTLAPSSGLNLQEPFAAGGQLSYVRRSFDGGWNYFIANRTSTNYDRLVSLNRKAKSIVLLDPLSKKTGLARGVGRLIREPLVYRAAWRVVPLVRGPLNCGGITLLAKDSIRTFWFGRWAAATASLRTDERSRALAMVVTPLL